MDDLSFQIRDEDGTLLTLTASEARRFLAIMDAGAEDEPLSPTLQSLRDQLAEWVDPLTDKENQ